MPTLKVYQSEKMRSQIPLDPAKKKYFIGSAAGSQILLRSPWVENNHCRLEWTDGHWVIIDLGSTRGTLVGDTPITEPHPLKQGDRIRIGDFLFEFDAELTVADLALETRDENTRELLEERDPKGFPTYSNMGREAEERAKAKILVLVMEGRKPVAVTLDKDMTLIGSGAHCDLHLDGWFIGEEQAVVLKDKTGLRIIGQGGVHPLRVNGEKVEEAYITPGDDIELAGYKFSVRRIRKPG